jgi:hypothetical protein
MALVPAIWSSSASQLAARPRLAALPRIKTTVSPTLPFRTWLIPLAGQQNGNGSGLIGVGVNILSLLWYNVVARC